MRREFSAGGVLVRRLGCEWKLAAIRPAGKPEGIWALPKGLIGPDERADVTALREVEEETGAHGRLVRKLGDVRYVYTWAGERVFKVVSFYLVRYSGGRLGAEAPGVQGRARDGRTGVDRARGREEFTRPRRLSRLNVAEAEAP
jgi:8-oxo-dGTP pyrophosphatase MutT (NUDIX family)